MNDTISRSEVLGLLYDFITCYENALARYEELGLRNDSASYKDIKSRLDVVRHLFIEIEEMR